VLGLLWTFVIFLPRARRIRADQGPNPPEPPMGQQLRLVGKVAGGAVVAVGIGIALAIWEPLLATVVFPILFYGYLTAVLSMVDRHDRRAPHAS
jgi:hypothetical protein